MYLVPIHVPIFKDADQLSVSTDWHRSLILLRDSLSGKFGNIVVAAPWVPAQGQHAQQLLNSFKESDGIVLIPGFDYRCRARTYWFEHKTKWQALLRSLVVEATVVHGCLDDLFRPIAYAGFKEGIRADKPTIYVQDTDIASQVIQLAQSLTERVKAYPYAYVYAQLCRDSVAKADVSFLKGSKLMERYGEFAKNAKLFQDTSHSVDDVISEPDLETRLTKNLTNPYIHFVYFGRLVARKGLDDSLRILKIAKEMGTDFRFDIIGAGPEKENLQQLTDELNLKGQVRFLGSFPYDKAFLKMLSRSYDALLFTPKAEDTPRMVFDGYAAGLPLIAYDIDYVKERALEDQSTLLLPYLNQQSSAALIYQLALKRKEWLADLSLRARAAGKKHCIENWYQQRAQWTFEMIDKKNSSLARLR